MVAFIKVLHQYLLLLVTIFFHQFHLILLQFSSLRRILVELIYQIIITTHLDLIGASHIFLDVFRIITFRTILLICMIAMKAGICQFLKHIIALAES